MFLTRPHTAVGVVQLGRKAFVPAVAAACRDDMEQVMRVFGAAVLGERAFRSLSDSRREQVRCNLVKAEFLGSGFPPLAPEAVRVFRGPSCC